MQVHGNHIYINSDHDEMAFISLVILCITCRKILYEYGDNKMELRAEK